LHHSIVIHSLPQLTNVFAGMKKVFVFLIFPLLCGGQNTIGLPDITNFTQANYGAGLQTWDIQQDKNGIIYFANNEGLLSFDGHYWTIYPLPNKTIVRSVQISNQGRIYVGGQDEIGYFAPGKDGKLQYVSLTSLIPKDKRRFGDVWDIAVIQSDVFFRSAYTIFHLANNRCALYAAPNQWSYLGLVNNTLYAHDLSAGILYFERNAWKPVRETNPLNTNDPVTGLLPLPGGSIMVTTLKNGVYTLSTTGLVSMASPSNKVFANERIYAAIAVSDQLKAFATNNSGLYIVDNQLNIIQTFSKKELLQNNNVLSIFLDAQQNLWLGLNNGIDLITYNSAIKHITPLQQDGSGYTSLVYHNALYLGTSNGLYSIPIGATTDVSFVKGTFEKIANSNGQAWKLSEINDRLLLGHHEGAFEIINNKALLIAKNAGFWNFVSISNIYPTTSLLAGNYKGLSFFSADNNQFRQIEQLNGFEESSRFVAIDQFQHIWVSHPFHGVFKLAKNNNGQYITNLYTDKNGLPSILNNHIYKVKNEVLVATEKGIYTYNDELDRFAPDTFYQKYLGNQSIRYITADDYGNIWFIHQKSLGVININDRQPSILYLPELNDKMLSGFESIYHYNESNIFLGAEKGFYHINLAKYKTMLPTLQVAIRRVHISDTQDSLLFGGYFNNVNDPQVQAGSLVPTIANRFKNINFRFASPVYGFQSNLQYSYRLMGFENDWSNWTGKAEKEYTNLPFGNYSFEVKVRSNLGNGSAVATYHFEILAPWYQSVPAIIFYILSAVVFVYWLYMRQQKKFKTQQLIHQKEQQRLVYIYQLERNNTQSELVNVQNQKLKADITFKNTELASSAMHLVKKGELLNKLKAELSNMMKRIKNDEATGELKKLIRSLNEDENIDNEWENFTRHFDSVHSGFVANLKTIHPSVTGNEIKLCAYLRMNLSSKEIAQLLNISARGVEIGRYRLRKKLGITTDVSLFEYLINIDHNDPATGKPSA